MSASAYDFDDDNPPTKNRAVSLRPQFAGEHIKQFCGMIVFGWGKVVTPGEHSGSKNRAYRKEFDERERETLSRLHAKAYGWELRTGYPDWICLSMENYLLLVRAGDFFASI